MKKVVSIGAQYFASLRERECFYIDKTDFIKEWWENEDAVTLITRPRRFGKTLNMSMLKCFFSEKYAKRTDLFEGLSIWSEEKYRKLQGSYPVIFLSFANVKGNTYSMLKTGLVHIIVDLIDRYHITSNRESGFGRYDVMLEPLDKERDFAYIFEFKVHDSDDEKTLENTVKSALEQIEEKNYDAILLAKGVKKDKIRHYGFAFEGKKVLIG